MSSWLGYKPPPFQDIIKSNVTKILNSYEFYLPHKSPLLKIIKIPWQVYQRKLQRHILGDCMALALVALSLFYVTTYPSKGSCSVAIRGPRELLLWSTSSCQHSTSHYLLSNINADSHSKKAQDWMDTESQFSSQPYSIACIHKEAWRKPAVSARLYLLCFLTRGAQPSKLTVQQL